MTTETLRRALGASVSMLITERKRIENEIVELEKRMASTNITDEQVRALQRNVEALEAEAAEKRELLARAEAHARTMERDRATAQQVAHAEAVAQCKSRIAALLDNKLSLIERAEALSRELLDLRMEILSANREARAEAARLGRTRVGPSDSELLARLSLRETKLMSQMPGCRHRYGHLVLPSGSFGLCPDGLTWREDEHRYHADLRVLIEQEG